MERGALEILHVGLPAEELVATGAFTLDGLFVRLDQALNRSGARRVALDSLESLFSALRGAASLRPELTRLFRWLRARELSTLVTAELGESPLTQPGLEEYVSDCVIHLDHRVEAHNARRRLRVLKYRGSGHGTGEYPFLIGPRGISVLPLSSATLDYEVSNERVSAGVADLDDMLGGQGYYQGSSVLVSGKAGTGKSTLAASFAAAACDRGERALYLAFEESAPQITRNMRSVGLDLAPHQASGLLRIEAMRPSLWGLEEHLVSVVDLVERVAPRCVVLDPISNFIAEGAPAEVKSLLTRILDRLKGRSITAMFTSLTAGSGRMDETEAKVSSLMDTWIGLDQELVGHHRRRALHIVKSRGMSHSQEVRDLRMTDRGLTLRPWADAAEAGAPRPPGSGPGGAP
jgi:circadian clock protein KaiC